ncbi:hypothetical protein GOV11_04615 [Candidatus Woesearchaeota archaeon]|nr:hypothetical protein [Candidatus Woesearchaeota archaeon]
MNRLLAKNIVTEMFIVGEGPEKSVLSRIVPRDKTHLPSDAKIEKYTECEGGDEAREALFELLDCVVRNYDHPQNEYARSIVGGRVVKNVVYACYK